METETAPIFGPTAPTINDLRGIRYTDLGGDGGGAGGAIDQTPDPNLEQEPTEYQPPTGDEPWAKYLENVPDVLQPELVGAFRELSSAADQRIAALTPYEPLAAAGIDPQQAQIAVEFAAMLYGQVDPNDPVATQLSKQQRLNFHNQYTAILQEQGILSTAEKAAADKAEKERIDAEREFETPEQKQLRELREQVAALEQQQQVVVQGTVEQQQQAQYRQLTEAYTKDWEAAILANGQVSKKEFETISMIANSDPDDSPGVIQRAYKKMIDTYGRLPDTPVTPATPQPKPPVMQASGAQQIPAPQTPTTRFDDPAGRGNRRNLALEAIAMLEQEGAPQV